MQIRIVNRGPSFQQITGAMVRDVQQATRRVGGKVADAGAATIEAQAPTWDGRRLGVTSRVRGSGGSRASVEFRGTPAGPWSILESGARPHVEKPTKREALKFGGRFAEMVMHPGVHGQHRWTKATKPVERAIAPVVEETYLRALD